MFSSTTFIVDIKYNMKIYIVLINEATRSKLWNWEKREIMVCNPTTTNKKIVLDLQCINSKQTFTSKSFHKHPRFLCGPPLRWCLAIRRHVNLLFTLKVRIRKRKWNRTSLVWMNWISRLCAQKSKVAQINLNGFVVRRRHC